MPGVVRYRLLHKIAHGGMAEIYLALQRGAEGFEKQVVLKRVLPALSADQQFVRMLVDEAHIASTLNHSNLVQVLDLGKSGGEFFLVLEFVDGWSVEEVRRRAQKAKVKLPLALSLYIVGALCRALAYVHTRKSGGRALNIVHRDVGPQNVLLSREGEVKLSDFGIAKAVTRREKSASGVIKGKFAYMSPEQANGLELDARSDLFSVGTLLYLLTTGRKPFEADSDVDVLMLVRNARYEKPSVAVKDFNPDVERFIVRALRADRSKRWQSAEQMADKLDAIRAKLGQHAGPAALKRWLENLSAKDGVRAPADVADAAARASVPPAPSGTIDLGSRDLELEDVAPATETEHDPDPATRPERRTPPARVRRSANLPAEARATADRRASGPVATLVARVRRWLRNAALATLALVVVLAGGAYLARDYLPTSLVTPVKAWLRGLPLPISPTSKTPKTRPDHR
jgi:eukaryotic-like serine/threonine-protein kinase